MHHFGHGNRNGGQAQITKSLAKLEQYPAAFCQIDNAKLIGDLRRLLEVGGMERIEIQITAES
jgi:hypothetical protein